MRVADYIAETLANNGVKTIHGLMGGGAACLNDAFLKNDRLTYLSFHHEQAAAYAAYGLAKKTRNFAVVNPTTGCGGMNCMTPLLNAWQESIPLVFISGNVGTKSCTNWLNRHHGTNRRYFGTQEHDIFSTVKNLTNYAVFVDDPLTVRYHLKAALSQAWGHNYARRQGPVWLDIPSDVQSALMPPEDLIPEYQTKHLNYSDLTNAHKVAQNLALSKKPLILAGNGIGSASEIFHFSKFVREWNIPVVTTYLGRDILEHDNPLNLGAIGIRGSRAANMAVQNCDLLVVVGSSMAGTQLGYDPLDFARNAKIIHVDTDIDTWLTSPIKNRIEFVHCPLQGFFDKMDAFTKALYELENLEKIETWPSQCAEWKAKWQNEQVSKIKPKSYLDLYSLIDCLGDIANDMCDIVTDAGSVSYAMPQVWKYKEGQKLMFSSAQADMGAALPMAIGVAYDNKLKENNRVVYCITGDGSLMSNLQELSTMKYHDLNLKLIVVNNYGYLSIRNTQNKYFNGNIGGTDHSHGVAIPFTFERIGKAFEIPYYMNETLKKEKVLKQLTDTGPSIIEFFCDVNQEITPTQAIKNGKQQPLDNMYPFEEENNEEQVTYHRV